jgi:ribonuclease HII
MDNEYLVNYKNVVGCDEVGRGPLAGPVNAAAVIINDLESLETLSKLNVTDSKKLTHKKRVKILEQLQIEVEKIELGVPVSIKLTTEVGKLRFRFCVTEHSPAEIDKMNILAASLNAMKSASEKLANKFSIILIDGNKAFESKFKTDPIVKGDSKSIAIGMASIIAKVFRDEKMALLDLEYPGYNLSRHAGYPTKEHRDAVKKLGPSPIHRKTFKGVKEYI